MFIGLLAQATEAASTALPHAVTTAVGSGNVGIGLGIAGIMIGAGIGIAGAARGIGNIGGSAVEAIARQPEAKGSIGTNMIISAALIEGFTFFALIIGLIAIVGGYLK
ncbi:MAG: ATP synthase F0 subunit C [Phycisphaerales bacterium]|nr:ATP synthase F0 subunit C [Phycisphaerales bacterium]